MHDPELRALAMPPAGVFSFVKGTRAALRWRGAPPAPLCYGFLASNLPEDRGR
jgi:hypothetical protein